MRRLLSILSLSLLLASACSRGEFDDTPCIELSVCCNDPVEVTRAGSDGVMADVDRYNENLINTVDFFIYPGETPDRSSDAAFHVRRTSGKRRSDVFRIEITSDDINTRIFPSSPRDIRKATVFAIANYPGTLVSDESNLGGTSLEELEAITVDTDFVSPSDHKQPNFLMSGTSVIALRGRSQIMAATGSVELVRYACKMTVGVNVSKEVTLGSGEIWSPMLEGMEIYLVNGVRSVRLGGEDREPVYFSYSSNRKAFVGKDVEGNLVPFLDMDGAYYNTYPMYMYPQRWTYGSNEGYDREPYLKLVVPWARSETNGYSSTQKQFYYKIVMPDDKRQEFRRRFERNNWYHLNIDVSILGAETDESAIPVNPGSCYMVYWQDKDIVIKQAEIGNARYLSVEKESYELNNVASTIVRYTTSHPVIIRNGSIRVTRPYYGDSKSGNALGGTIRKAGANDIYPQNSYYLEYNQSQREAMNGGEDWFTNTGTGIIYSHELNNDYKLTTFEYSPFTVSFTLVHEDRPDDTRYMKKITIVQYPAIFIEATPNSDDTFVYIREGSAGRKIHTSEHWGYVYVDNEQLVRQGEKNLADYADLAASLGYSTSEYHWRAIWYTGGSRDIFKMNVTVLPPNSDFVIGDPRSSEVQNPRNNFHEAPALSGPSPRRLQWYYPAESSSRTVNMMAPSYRIASKCGGIEFGPITMEQATCRCATYQEDGFPAGRWRLPTRGEINFIAMLSANKAFTYLFSNSVYWSANGAIQVNEGSVKGVSDKTALVRCVYDTWYWGDEQQEDRSQFVWGDAPR